MCALIVGPLTAVLVLGLPVQPVSAQPDALVVSDSSIGVMTASQTDARIAELEKAYNDVKLAGPRAGVGMSAILVPGGIFMLGVGPAIRNFELTFLCPARDPNCGDPGPAGPALIASGVVALAGGTTGLILASRKLKQKKNERRELAREIDTLKRSLPPGSD